MGSEMCFRDSWGLAWSWSWAGAWSWAWAWARLWSWAWAWTTLNNTYPSRCRAISAQTIFRIARAPFVVEMVNMLQSNMLAKTRLSLRLQGAAIAMLLLCLKVILSSKRKRHVIRAFVEGATTAWRILGNSKNWKILEIAWLYWF